MRLSWLIYPIVLAAELSHAAEAVVVASGEVSQAPGQPQLAIDASGVIHLAYGVGNAVMYCRSQDGGATFDKPVTLPGTKVLALGMRRGPRITAARQFVCITAIGGTQGKGRDGDVLAYSSSDGGKAWSGPTTVNDSPNSAREGLHAMAAGAEGELCCVWLDLRNGSTELFAAVSQDGGKRWGKNILVYRSPDGHVCECCHPSVAYDGQGNLHVMWRNWLGGARDMYVSRSTDGGHTFEPARKLGQGTWPLDACPMDGGYVATGPKGEVFTAWRRDREVFLTKPGAAELRLGAGEQPWIAASAEGPYVVWLEEGTERLLMRAPGDSHSVELAPKAAAPVIAAALNDAGPVVAAWEARHGKRTSILCNVISPRNPPD
jgi:hypothetical protein